MKNSITAILIGLIIGSCSTDKKNIMTVQGEIKNLKKGVIYLQKMKDTLLVSVDSVVLDGVNTFSLSDEVESPEMYFLSLDKSPSKVISFFGEPGAITINTKLEKFAYGASITGLTNQQLLDEYNAMKGQFRDKRLNLIKADFETKKSGDSLQIDSIQNEINNLTKTRYRFAIGFALRNSDKEVAPYLALTEFFDANPVWLDSLNNTLSPEVKTSKYGKELEKYIADIKSDN